MYSHMPDKRYVHPINILLHTVPTCMYPQLLRQVIPPTHVPHVFKKHMFLDMPHSSQNPHMSLSAYQQNYLCKQTSSLLGSMHTLCVH